MNPTEPSQLDQKQDDRSAPEGAPLATFGGACTVDLQSAKDAV